MITWTILAFCPYLSNAMEVYLKLNSRDKDVLHETSYFF